MKPQSLKDSLGHRLLVQITTAEQGTVPSVSAYNLEIVERTLSTPIRSR